MSCASSQWPHLDNPNQPRRVFDEESLVSLADSIEPGVIQPMLVGPIVAGRYESSPANVGFAPRSSLGSKRAGYRPRT